MKRFASHSAILLAAWLGASAGASAQSVGPTATPTTLSFSYIVNSSTFPAAATVKITVPTSLASLPLQVTAPDNFIVVTPLSGYAPLTLTVSFNPTGLAPGSQPPQTISVDTYPASGVPAIITVNATVSNPPPVLQVNSPQNGTYYTAGSGSNPNVVTLTYTTGAGSTTVPPPAASPGCNMELDVSSTGGIIPFTVTAANVKASGTSGTSGSTAIWVRVNSPGQLPTTSTSGVANTGSYAPICVTADLPTIQTLNPGSYSGQITIAAANSVNGTWVILVDLTVSAGPPVLNSMSPNQIVANPTLNPVFTLYGDNFFNTSVVNLISPLTNTPISGVTTTLLSRGVLQATVPSAYFTVANEGSTYPVIWPVSVMNPATPSSPTPQVATLEPPNTLEVLDPGQPLINQVVNAASFLPTSTFTGTPASNNPNTTGGPTVAPREIISIFGLNLGPSSVYTASPTTSDGVQYYQNSLTAGNITVQVLFTYTTAPVPPAVTPTTVTAYAPIIMFTSNQINAIVPYDVENAIASGTSPSPTATIQAIISTATSSGGTSVQITPITNTSTVTILQEDPGLFTFGGAGQGQAAVLNQDYSINGTKNAAARGSTIQLFVTGMGELEGTTQQDGTVAGSQPVPLNDQTVVVQIAGQPADVTYAGTSPGSVDGLVQVNVIIPPTVTTGSSVPITVSIGQPSLSHRTQSGATICVK
jgi:trimeric autotransporter adhesin